MANYELIFEGCDSSPETLRKLKTVLIADLDLDVETVRAALEHPPATLRSAEHREELEKALKILEGAGAQVLIIDRAPPAAEKSESGGMVFEFELSLDEETPTKNPPPPEPVEEEKIDSATSGEIDSLLSELGQNEYVVPAREKAQVAVPERLLRVRPAEPAPPQYEPPSQPEALPVSAPPAAAQPAEPEAVMEPEPHHEVDRPAASTEPEPQTPDTEPATLDVPPQKRAKKQRRKFTQPTLRPEFVVSIGLSLILLAIVSLARMGSASGSEIRGIESAFQQMAQSAERTGQRNAKTQVIEAPPVVIHAEQQDGIARISGTLSIVSGKLRKADLTITTPKPPALTPEQIGRHEIGAPWLYKIEADNWDLKADGEQRVTGKAAARLNIDHRGFRQRTVGEAQLSAEWNEAAQTLAVDVTVSGGTPPGDPSAPGIVYTGMNSYRIYVKASGTFAAPKGDQPATTPSAAPTKESPKRDRGGDP